VQKVLLACGVASSLLYIVAADVIAALQGPNLAAGLPTPRLGVTERINIGVFLLWVVVLALTLCPKRTGAQTLLGTDEPA
jgi:hypothetical protein